MPGFNLADYEPVEDRLARFWQDYPDGRVWTSLVAHDAGQWIIRAEVYRDAADPQPTATGYAEERTTDRGVNATSALENCETSAIGRALANAGYATKGKRPSREEMVKAQRSPGRPALPTIPEPDFARLLDALTDAASLEELDAARQAVADAMTRWTIGPADLGALAQLRDTRAAELTGRAS